MLQTGTPLPYWQVTPLQAAEYNVADMPMEGKMDSTFFLTKEKNFIPHTYPCRTAYIAEQRGKPIDTAQAPDWAGARNVLPAGSPFLDLSGFWFRATKIQGWARTAIEAKHAGKAQLKLGICGEHGGDPASIAFCESVGLDYVSASPYRVPIARLAAAQAALKKA